MIEWLDRALFVSPYYYALCTTEKQYKKELRKMAVPKEEWPFFITNDATTHFFEKGDGGLCAIVCIRPRTKDRSMIQLYALLVHEAVHIWQHILKEVGEHSPSSEFEAYAIQTLSQRLMEAYKRSQK